MGADNFGNTWDDPTGLVVGCTQGMIKGKFVKSTAQAKQQKARFHPKGSTKAHPNFFPPLFVFDWSDIWHIQVKGRKQSQEAQWPSPPASTPWHGHPAAGPHAPSQHLSSTCHEPRTGKTPPSGPTAKEALGKPRRCCLGTSPHSSPPLPPRGPELQPLTTGLVLGAGAAGTTHPAPSPRPHRSSSSGLGWTSASPRCKTPEA